MPRAVNATTFPPKRNLKVGEHRGDLAATPSAVNETSTAGSHFQFSTAWPCTRPPRVKTVSQVGLSLPFRTQSATDRRACIPRRFRKAPTLFPPSLPAAPMQVNKRLRLRVIFFYRCHARYRRPFLRCCPPRSNPLLSLGIGRCCWFAVRYGIGIKRIDQPRSSSSFFLNTQIDGDASFSG